MENINFIPGITYQLQCTTTHVYNAICEAIYLACKQKIEINMEVEGFCMNIDSDTNPKQTYEKYKNWITSKNTTPAISLVTKN